MSVDPGYHNEDIISVAICTLVTRLHTRNTTINCRITPSEDLPWILPWFLKCSRWKTLPVVGRSSTGHWWCDLGRNIIVDAFETHRRPIVVSATIHIGQERHANAKKQK